MIDAMAQWAARWPQAAAELRALSAPSGADAAGLVSEAGVQAAVRVAATRAGWRVWRNNVGAVRTEDGRFLRFGLANDSERLNAAIKSADLIGVRPVLITPEWVGHTLGQFVSLECKRPGWHLTPGDERGQAQARWAEIVTALGGHAKFITGPEGL